MACHQFLCGQPAPPAQRAQFRHLAAIAGDVVALPLFYLIHDIRRVIAELALSDDLHGTMVASRASWGYTPWRSGPTPGQNRPR